MRATSRRTAALALGGLLAGALAAGCSGGADGPPQAQPPASRAQTSTSSAATTTTRTAPTSSCPGTACVTITLTGDVLLHEPLWQQAQRDARAAGEGPTYDFRPLLAGQRPWVQATDLAFCHLETPLAPAGGPLHEYPSFSVPPQVATALRQTGYDACTTASNHTLDQGDSGVRRTLDDLDAVGLRHTGSARSAAERARALTFDVRGTKVALLAYAYGLNGRSLPAGKPWEVNLIDPARILRDAHAARAAGADVVVVALHWGTEYVHQPTADQRAVARRLLASPDVDLVYGHHAHVVQPVEKVGGKWVVWGLGNAVAAHGNARVDNREGLLVQVQLVRDGSGRWRGGRLGWVASYVWTPDPLHRPYRWTVRPSSRVRAVVDSRGAARQGAVELTAPISR